MRENAKLWCQRVVVQKGIEGLKTGKKLNNLITSKAFLEFVSMKRPVDPNSAKVFLEQPSGTRNRYRDVVCLDKSRVVLKNAENDCKLFKQEF